MDNYYKKIISFIVDKMVMIILALYFNAVIFVSCNSNEIKQNSASYIASEYKIVPYGKDAQLKCSVASHEPKKELFWIKYL